MDNTHLDPSHPAAPRPPLGPPPPHAPQPTDPLGPVRTLGEYHILRRLGEGGMGAVYLAYHGRLGTQVALKVLNDHLASNQGYIDRFYREAKSGTLLNHPNIVSTLTAGQDRATGKHYLVLEYVDGPSAHALLDRGGPLPVGDAVHITLDVARALEYAHSRNFVHRDIKPDNILLTRSGVAKLGDLGLAKRTDEASHLTAARQGFGTTAYMPYEQAINAKHADGRSDIYALGATLYHLVTGAVPFPGDNHLEVVDKKHQGYYAPASDLNPAVPPALNQVLARMLACRPRDRYQTASELIIDLERSRLAAALPSFADPELAKRDPWVQALRSTAEPTRPDPEAVPRPAADGDGHPAPAADVWLVRYAGRDGKVRTARQSTAQLAQRLRAGTLPPKLRLKRPDDGAFRPLAEVAEFQGLLPPPKDGPPPESADAPAAPWWTRLLFVAGGVALTGGALVGLWRLINS